MIWLRVSGLRSITSHICEVSISFVEVAGLPGRHIRREPSAPERAVAPMNEGSGDDIPSLPGFGAVMSDGSSPFEIDGLTISELKAWISGTPKSADATEMEPGSFGSTGLNDVSSLPRSLESGNVKALNGLSRLDNGRLAYIWVLSGIVVPSDGGVWSSGRSSRSSRSNSVESRGRIPAVAVEHTMVRKSGNFIAARKYQMEQSKEKKSKKSKVKSECRINTTD